MDNNVKHIDVLIFDNVNILDIAGPVQAFKTARRGSQHAYTLRYVSIDGAPITSCCGLKLMPDGVARSDSAAEDLLIPGGTGVDKALTDQRVTALIRGWLHGHEGRQLKSVCSGSLLLANAGVLDGMDATTHWSRQQQAKTDYPNVNWKMDQLYAFNDRIATSAGVTSGIDMALAVIRKECGAQSALDVARELVVYLHRSGGQNQFTDALEAQFSGGTSISKLTSALSQKPQHPWTLDMMADFLGMTPRTLSRRFMKEVGLPPVRFLEKIRVKQACDTISAGMPVLKAIDHSGFGDFQQMQRAFKRQLGTTIGEYGKRFVVRA